MAIKDNQLIKKIKQIYHDYKHYKVHDWRHVQRNLLVVVMTLDNMRNGLADRLKGIVSSYILAVENKRDFRIYHTSGFNMEDYLIPNKYNWRITFEELSQGINNTRVINDFRYSLPKLNKNVPQYHVRSIFDILENCDNLPYNWGEVFNLLFKPTERLANLISKKKLELNANDSYIAVHARFLDAIDSVESPNETKVRNTSEIKALINSVIKTIDLIHRKHPLSRVLIFSDSQTFLREEFPSYCIPMLDKDEVIGHVGRLFDKKIADKAFIDLFMLASASHIYNICGSPLWNSGYSEYASKINGSKFVRMQRCDL